MNFKGLVAAAGIGAATLASPAAFAGFTANVGGVSEYMFRGIAQTGGAAVQGGIDYASDVGIYAGTWASNIGFAGGTEQDFYVGFSKKFGSFGIDVGGLYYWYPEEDQSGEEYSTFEVYGGVSFGPVAVKYSFSSEANFFLGTGDADEAGYLGATLALPISDTLNVTASVGLYDGDEIENFLAVIGSTDDTYIDYSIGLAKTLEGGYTVTFQYVATDIDTGTDDDPKFVIGLKKGFDL